MQVNSSPILGNFLFDGIYLNRAQRLLDVAIGTERPQIRQLFPSAFRLIDYMIDVYPTHPFSLGVDVFHAPAANLAGIILKLRDALFLRMALYAQFFGRRRYPMRWTAILIVRCIPQQNRFVYLPPDAFYRFLRVNDDLFRERVSAWTDLFKIPAVSNFSKNYPSHTGLPIVGCMHIRIVCGELRVDVLPRGMASGLLKDLDYGGHFRHALSLSLPWNLATANEWAILLFRCSTYREETMLVKGIVLDYDGVLLDSFRGGLRKIRTLCALHEVPFGRQARSKLTEAWGKPGIELLHLGLSISRELAERINRDWIKWDNTEPPELVPGTRDVMLWLEQNGFKCCLLTSRHRDNTEVMLKAQDLRDKFAGVCAREDVPHHKPDPRSLRPALELLQDQFGIAQHNCVFVGDTPSDIEAGHRANVRTLVVQTGPYLLKHSDKTFGDKKVELANILPSIDDLPFWIEENHEGELIELYN